jgi:hypothetical protein
VLGDPNLRISYDIENKITPQEEFKRSESEMKFYRRYGKRVMRGPSSLKSFYYNKWTGFKVPKWSNLNDGHDMKSDYLYREDENIEEMTIFSYSYRRFKRRVFKYRMFVYLLWIMAFDLIFLWDNYHLYKDYKMCKKAFFDK